MILKALYDYYQRLRNFDVNSVPLLGFKEQEIHFVIVIDDKGELLRIEDRRIDKRTCQTFYVVADSRSSGIKPYVLYDNLEYVFSYDKGDKPEKAKAKHLAFVNQCRHIASKYPNCKVFQAIVEFYNTDGPQKVMRHQMWDEMQNKAGAMVSFMLNGDTDIAACKPEIENETLIYANDTKDAQYCLITGDKAPIVEITTGVLIPGGNPTGAKIVSFQENSGYDSYGKKKGANAPISRKAESAFSVALLKLLGKNSPNKISVSNRTLIFWTSALNKESDELIGGFASLLGSRQDKNADPNEAIEKLKSSLLSIYTGKNPYLSDERFYLLGLSPNSARIAVNYWVDATIKDIATKILRHFDDMEIVDSRKIKTPYTGLYRMLASVTLGGKASDAQPNLADSLIKSIVEGTQYPYTLYISSLRRIRAEQSETLQITRVAILKAYLNRLNDNQQKLNIMLDLTNQNVGYVCGRLFAALEYAQKRANGINTIRERYMNSASATPAAVFPTLLNLSNHHVEKLPDPARVFIERLKQSIIAVLPPTGFPAHLNIQDQGRFFVGYYHQMQDLYTSKKTDEN